MTSSKSSQPEIQSIRELAELAQRGVIFSQIETLWEKLLGFSIEETIQSSEFRKEGIIRLVKLVEEEAPNCADKDSLLERLNFLKENNEKLINLLDPNKNAVQLFLPNIFIKLDFLLFEVIFQSTSVPG